MFKRQSQRYTFNNKKPTNDDDFFLKAIKAKGFYNVNSKNL